MNEHWVDVSENDRHQFLSPVLIAGSNFQDGRVAIWEEPGFLSHSLSFPGELPKLHWAVI